MNKKSKVNYVWVKLGRTWWPGEEVSEVNYTEEMRNEIKGKSFRKFVQFLNEEERELVKKECDMKSYSNMEVDKKEELIRKGAGYLGKLSDGKSRTEKFRADVIWIDSLVSGRTKELTGVWFDKLVEAKEVPKKFVKEIFGGPPDRAERPTNKRVSSGRGQIIDKNKIVEDVKKRRYSCTECEFSCDRLGGLTSHRRMHTLHPSVPVSVKKVVGVSPKKVVGVSPKKVVGVKKVKAVKKVKGVDPLLNKVSILADWEDGMEEMEEDEAPPELRLFETEMMADEKSGRLLKVEREEPTLTKKGLPRTDKELSDAFEELLRTTKVPVDGDRVGSVVREEPELEKGEESELEKGEEPELEREEPQEGDEPELKKGEEPEKKEEPELEKGELEEGEEPELEKEEPEKEKETEVREEEPELNKEEPKGEEPEKGEELVETKLLSVVNLIDSPVVELEMHRKPTAAIRPTTQEKQESSEKASSSGGQKLETDQIVHLVPVENPDGSVTYMLLSLNNQQVTQGGLKVATANIPGPSSQTEGGLIMNSSEMEGIYLDKSMDAGSVFSSILDATNNKEETSEQQVIYMEAGEDNNSLTWETIQQLVNNMNENSPK